MAKVVLICNDRSECEILTACLKGHEITTVTSLKDAAKALTAGKPDLVVARVDPKDRTGFDVLRLMKRSQIDAPAVVALPRSAGPLESEAIQLGVQQFIRGPIRYEEVRNATEAALKSRDQKADEDIPPITSIERRHNLTELSEKLTRHMKCPAGANRVVIRSQLGGEEGKSEPRVCLRCPIKQAVGMHEYAYFEHIRDHCCNDVQGCPALKLYKKLRQAQGGGS